MGNQEIRLFTIPNFITGLNLLSGCVGIVFALSGDLNVAMVCLLLSAVFDFCDGFAARLLNSYSAVGVQLDSLADVVSFGVLPSSMMFVAISHMNFFTGLTCEPFMYSIAFCPFLLTFFSALRLAKFNIDERQSTSFLGLPTPANALFFSSFSVVYGDIANRYVPNMVNLIGIPALVLLFSILLISEIPMFSLKIKDFSVKKYALQLLFIVLSAGLLVIMLGFGMPVAAFPAIILMYIVLSIAKWLLKV